MPFDRYTFGWFEDCLAHELEHASDREITIICKEVKAVPGMPSTYILSEPDRDFPAWLDNIDLDVNPLIIEQNGVPGGHVVGLDFHKSDELLIRLNEDEGLLLNIPLTLKATNSLKFLLEALKKGFEDLGLHSDRNMRDNVPKRINFIFGPPGTGKTTYLVKNTILPEMQQNQKVLVLTPTNKAADVVVKRILSQTNGDCKDWLVRFGHCVDEEIVKSGIPIGKQINIDRMEKCTVVTTIARFPYDYFRDAEGHPGDNNEIPHTHCLRNINWDLIVFDEASMISLGNIVYPLTLQNGSRFVIAGDPFQIAPIVQYDDWKEENIYTMMQLQDFRNPVTVPKRQVKLLTNQYRSLPCIGEIYSKYRYSGLLRHFRNPEQPGVPRGFKPLTVIKFPVHPIDNSVYDGTRNSGRSPYHIHSAILSAELLAHVAKQIPQNNKFRISVVSPYKAQKKLVYNLVKKLRDLYQLSEEVEIDVNTVHGFQGEQCEMVVVLCNLWSRRPLQPIRGQHNAWLKNVLNVAISRAQDYLVLMMPDDDGTLTNPNDFDELKKIENLMIEQQGQCNVLNSAEVEQTIFGQENFIEEHSAVDENNIDDYRDNHQGKPARYEFHFGEQGAFIAVNQEEEKCEEEEEGEMPEEMPEANKGEKAERKRNASKKSLEVTQEDKNCADSSVTVMIEASRKAVEEARRGYLVMNLAEQGTQGPFLPYRYSVEEPDVSKEAWRTTELWLKFIPKGSFEFQGLEITMTRGFYIGVLPVTQKQWELMKGKNPTPAKYRDPGAPVICVSYNAICGENCLWPEMSAVGSGSFLEHLRQKTGLNGLGLPTLAQWNMAQLNCGNCSKPIWEWCADWYHDQFSETKDPKGPMSGEERILCNSTKNNCIRKQRPAIDHFYSQRERNYCYLGFRIVFVPETK